MKPSITARCSVVDCFKSGKGRHEWIHLGNMMLRVIGCEDHPVKELHRQLRIVRGLAENRLSEISNRIVVEENGKVEVR